MDNEIMTVSDRVINRIAKNEYGQISTEISQESASQLICGLCEVLTKVSGQSLDAVVKIYSDALMRQENLEIKNMDNEAEVMRRFNDQIDKAMDQLDFSKPETVTSFELVCGSLRDNLLSQFEHKHNPSLLEKLFKRGKKAE